MTVSYHFQERAGLPMGSSPTPRGGSTSSPLLERIARGDQGAVGECLDRHGALVWSLARRFCANHSDAEDLVQDVFIELWKNAHRFNPAKASETTFVAMIARRRLIDHLRKSRSRPISGPLPEDLAAITASPPAEQADDVARAAEALGMLREEQREVLTRSLRDGLSYDQIARTTGLPLGTVKTHARRGLIRLRQLMDAPVPRPTVSRNATGPKETGP